MIDNFSILLSHGLLAIALWLLLPRGDLDNEALPEPDKEPQGFSKKRKMTAQAQQEPGDA